MVFFKVKRGPGLNLRTPVLYFTCALLIIFLLKPWIVYSIDFNLDLPSSEIFTQHWSHRTQKQFFYSFGPSI